MARLSPLIRTLAAATVFTAVVTTTAAPSFAKTTEVKIPMSCRGTPSGLPVGGKDFHSSGINATVNAPDSIEVGKTGEISFQIHPIHIRMPKLPLGAKFVDASRMKVDFRIPKGLKFVNARIAGHGSSLDGFTAKTVNEAGMPDPNGRILRLVGADDATVGHSPNVSNNSAGGIIVPVSDTQMTISFPQVITTFEGVTPGTYDFAVNTAGAAANYNADENFFSILVHLTAPVVGDVWASARCTPKVHEDDPIDPNIARIVGIKVVPQAAEKQPDRVAKPEEGEKGDSPEASKQPVPETEFQKNLAQLTSFVLAHPQYLPMLLALG